MNEWISVEDRLPEDNHDRIIAFKVGDHWRFVEDMSDG